MYTEVFLTKIALAVLKAGLINAGLTTAARAIEVYSIFSMAHDLVNRVKAIASCDALEVFGIEVLSDKLADAAADMFVSRGQDVFVIDKSASGVYIASSIAPTFQGPVELQRLYDKVHFEAKGTSSSFRKYGDDTKFRPR